jgi:hypothetical protein
MRARPVSDAEWFGIRAAARRRDWDEVVTRAEELGWPILAHHARRAAADYASLRCVVAGLLLDRPDAPDPFAEESPRAS